MSFFTGQQKINLARSLFLKSSPSYVQFYITARCNLTCEQCNIIYADSSGMEMTIEQIRLMAKNFKKIGVSIVLLIGGEPFMRKDLPEIIKVFNENGIHTRMQTNGMASEQALKDCVDAGGHDISISLDSLNFKKQETINGGYSRSWERAIRAASLINNLFPENGTGFFGTVLMPRNFLEIRDVVEFATKIGWGVSLVPGHVTTPDKPLGFRTFDDTNVCKFDRKQYPILKEVISDLKKAKKEGMNLYDSDEYLDDIYRFIVGEPLKWRKRNYGVCDSPSLYFAVEPNGNLKPCCDFKMKKNFPVYHDDFPEWYFNKMVHKEVEKYTLNCDGCMYGSYPEISITARYFKPFWERFFFFNKKAKSLLKPLSVGQMVNIATEIYEKNNEERIKKYGNDFR
ncbi:radical SAM protein [Bacteriovoracales bacterium]|nr:radical SAM protein [Bacteriovoracales bacterium]